MKINALFKAVAVVEIICLSNATEKDNDKCGKKEFLHTIVFL